MFPRAQAAALVVVALTVPAAAGCGPSKRKQCDALVGIVNDGVQRLEQVKKQQKNDPTGQLEVLAMADAMEKASRDAAALKLDLAELRDLSGRYQAMTKAIAASARAVVAHAEKKETEPMKKAQQELNEAFKLEDGILEGLNKACAE